MTAETGDGALSETRRECADIRRARLVDRIVLIPVIAGAFARRRANRRARPVWWVAYAFSAAVDLSIKQALCRRDRCAVVCWSPGGSRRETAAGVLLGVAVAGLGFAAAVLWGAVRVLANLRWAAVLALVAALTLAWLAMLRGWRRRRPLRMLRPTGAWFVSSLTSTIPGAGSDLLVELCRQADEAGRDLCLDAPVGPLTDRYYPRFGFEARNAPVTVGPTRRLQVMVRPAGSRHAREVSRRASSGDKAP